MTKEQLFEQNQALVWHTYNKLTKCYVVTNKQEDLIQIGYLALWEAVSNFDETKGYKFSTYSCTYIRNAMLTFIKKEQINHRRTFSLDTPVSDEDNSDGAVIGDILAVHYDEPNVHETVEHILKIYNKWLVKKQRKNKQVQVDLWMNRAKIILYELLNDSKVTSRQIQEKYGINRTNVTNVLRDIRMLLQHDYPTKFKNRRTRTNDDKQFTRAEV